MAYPSEIERRRLERFPEQIAVETSTRASRSQTSVVRSSSRCAEPPAAWAWRSAVRAVVSGVRTAGSRGTARHRAGVLAGQVDAAAHELLEYGARPRTRVDRPRTESITSRARAPGLPELLGYQSFDSATAAALEPWLGERAVEHDAPSVLLALATEHLHARRIIRPSLERLLRLMATARAAAHARIEAALTDQLAPDRRVELDALLVAPAGGRSELALLKERAGRVGVAELRRQVERYRRLLELRADRIDLGSLAPARRRQLVAAGMRMTAQAIARLEPARRYPLILAVLAELYLERGDELLDLFEKLLRYADTAPAAASTSSVRRLPANATSLRRSRASSHGSSSSRPRQGSCRWTASSARSVLTRARRGRGPRRRATAARSAAARRPARKPQLPAAPVLDLLRRLSWTPRPPTADCSKRSRRRSAGSTHAAGRRIARRSAEGVANLGA